MQRSEMYGTEGLSWVLGWKGKKQRWLHGSENAICFFPYVSMLVIFLLMILMQHWFLDSVFVYKQTMNTLLKKAGIEESPDDHKDDNHGGDSGKQVSFLNSKWFLVKFSAKR